MVLTGLGKTMESKYPLFGHDAKDFDNALADYKAKFGKDFPGDGRKESRYAALYFALEIGEEATIADIEAHAEIDQYHR